MRYKFIYSYIIKDTGGEEGHALIFSCENSKITTHWWTTIDRRCWIPPREDTAQPRVKKKPRQDGRRDKIMFRVTPHSCQRHSEGSNKTLCFEPGPRDPRDWTRPVFECLLNQTCVWVSPEPDLCLSVWTRPVLECLNQTCVWVSPGEAWVSSGLPWGQGSGCSYLGHTACGVIPLGGGGH